MLKKLVFQNKLGRVLISSFLVIFFMSFLTVSNGFAEEKAAVVEEETVVTEEQNSSGDYTLEEVIITSEKREATVQATPLAITAFSSDMLESKGVKAVEDLQFAVPGLVFGNTWTGGANVVLRGIGSVNSNAGGDTGVGFYMDGHYLQWTNAIAQDFFDIKRIEVLRGPQGTLYGRNSTGGTINVITNKPGNDFSGEISVLGGNYDRRMLQAAVNIPILTDKLQARVAISDNDREGYIENIFTGQDFGDSDYTNVRTMLRILPSDNFDILLTYFDYYSRNNGNVQVMVEPYPQFVDYGIGFLLSSNYAALPGAVNPSLADPWIISDNNYGQSAIDQEGLTLEMNWDLGFMSIKSLSAWVDGSMDMIFPSSLSWYINETITSVSNMETFTQELQFLSSDEARHKWVFGLYYYKEDSDSDFIIFNEPAAVYANSLMGSPLDANLLESKGQNDAYSYAAFGQIDFKISDKLTMTTGLRYTKDSKDFKASQHAPVYFEVENYISVSDSWTSFSGKIGATYEFSEEMLAYASLTRGYKAGGFNASGVATGASEGYDPEYINGFEMGIKNMLFDSRMMLNVSGFHYLYKDMIVSMNTPTEVLYENAAEATISGLEMEWVYRPTHAFTLDASVAYLNGEYDDYVTINENELPATGVVHDLSGNKLNQSPEWSLHLGAEYAFQLPGKLGTVTPRVDFAWIDEHYFSQFNLSSDHQDAYHRTNFKIKWNSPSGAWLAEVFVKNIEDDAIFQHRLTTSPTVGAAKLGIWMPPRTFGMKITYSW